MTASTTGRRARTGPDLIVSAVLALACSSWAVAGQGESLESFRDARMQGQLEAIYALNDQLSAFDLDATVREGVVQLSGTVPSAIDRELAAELARSIDGVTAVRNDLQVAASEAVPPARRARLEAAAKEREQLRRSIADATTSAIVKSKLQANQNTKDLHIEVKTQNSVVTLSGEVGSAEERELAELLARNARKVGDVRNELRIRSNRAAHY